MALEWVREAGGPAATPREVVAGDPAVQPAVELVDYRCNICGKVNLAVPQPSFGREDGSCRFCGSSVRMRSVVHHLAMGLFQAPVVLPEFPSRPELRGVGLSDWEGMAGPLARKLGYQNTFYHQAPQLDIVAPIPPHWRGKNAFVLSSDVLEHVPPPVGRAFLGCFELLQPGGLLVLTVPFGAKPATVEHFPELNVFTIAELGADRVLVNRTRSGALQVFDNLVFHGGPGATLELREFARADVVQHLHAAGFVEVRVHEAGYRPFGILHQHMFGLAITAWRPTAG